MNNKFDGLTLALVLALGAISTTVIFAANKNLAIDQLIFWFFGLGVFYIVCQILPETWQKISTPLFAVSIAALLLIFLIGSQVKGSVRWIDLGVFRFQPSEIAKVATVISLAVFFKSRSANNLPTIIKSILLISPVFLLIFFQPDIGSAAAVIAVWLGIIFASRVQKKHVLYLGIISALIVFLSYEFLAPYQKERIVTFLNPTQDPLGSGYNIIQSKIAVGSGQIFGRGLGRGTQSQLNFLPEAQSDFIYASISEELGFLGGGLVIVLFGCLLLRIAAYLKSEDRFSQLVATGALSLILYQFLVSIGMNMGLLPVTGITLPFVSYGGSSLVSMLLLLGIIFSLKTRKY